MVLYVDFYVDFVVLQLLFWRNASKSTVFLEFSINYSIFASFHDFLRCFPISGDGGRLGKQGRHVHCAAGGGTSGHYATELEYYVSSPGCSI
jgi:hypothetical protein